MVTSMSTHPVRVVDHDGVRIAIVGGVCIRVIAKPSQHGGDLGHVLHHIAWDVASPLGQSFQVHRLDDLVCGTLDPGERGQAGGAGHTQRPMSSWRSTLHPFVCPSGTARGWGRVLIFGQLCLLIVRQKVYHMASSSLLYTAGQGQAEDARRKYLNLLSQLVQNHFCTNK